MNYASDEMQSRQVDAVEVLSVLIVVSVVHPSQPTLAAYTTRSQG